MRDNELFILLKSILDEGQAYAGIPVGADGKPGVLVIQSYQPTQQGTPTKPAAFLDVIGEVFVGQPYRADFYDEDNQVLVHRERQCMRTMFQLSGLVKQNEESTTELTAADVVRTMGMILQNQKTIQRLVQNDCGIQLDRTIRNPKFIDDSGQFEASPSLDFTITHNVVVNNEVPVLQSWELDIYAI